MQFQAVEDDALIVEAKRYSEMFAPWLCDAREFIESAVSTMNDLVEDPNDEDSQHELGRKLNRMGELLQ